MAPNLPNLSKPSSLASSCPSSYPMPTAAMLSQITAQAIAMRRAANLEGQRTAGCLSAVAW